MSFNLVDEPWIPVLKEGSLVELSLWDALLKAHEVTDLQPEVPTLVPAILRQVLLPLILDACGCPESDEEWGARWQRGSFEEGLFAEYLELHRDRFDLFHPIHPFGQVADLRTASDEPKPVSLLIPAITTGNSVPLFSARTMDNPPDLTPSQATRWMLHAQCWDTAAIKPAALGDAQAKNGKVYGNPVGTLGALGVLVPLGRNLFETILLNTEILDDGLPTGDLPPWRMKPQTATWTERAPRGPIDLLTWRSRRIRLIPIQRNKEAVIKHALVTGGDRLLASQDLEPHTAWTRRDTTSEFKPKRHVPGRSAWEGLTALISLSQDGPSQTAQTSHLLEQISGRVREYVEPSYPLRVLAVGINYGNKSAVVDSCISDAIPLPVASLRAEAEVRAFLEELVGATRRLAYFLNRLARDLRIASGEDDQLKIGRSAGERFVHLLDPAVRRILVALQSHPDQTASARAAWRTIARYSARSIADELCKSVPPSAYQIKRKDGKLAPNAALAEMSFRREVRKVLPEEPEEVGQ